MSDQLKRYILPDYQIRTQIVHLDDTWRNGLHHQNLPSNVKQLIGELIAATTLLAANIKFNGSLILQIQGDGPIPLMVAECSANLSVRATASLKEGVNIPDTTNLQKLMNQTGNGRFAVILDPKDKTEGMQAYQGVVPLEGPSIAQALEHYMLSSEQLDTKLWLAANNERCAGLLLQRLPNHGGHNEDNDTSTDTNLSDTQKQFWDNMLPLFDTLDSKELLETSPDTLMHRFFWQDQVRALGEQHVTWHCPCSRERVQDMLKMLGKSEIDSIIEEKGEVNVACNFCGKPYTFDVIDCTSLFVEMRNRPGGSGSSIH